MRTASPIFIGGDGRSGTTLLSVVLDSHPRLRVGPELHFRGPPNLGPYVLDMLDRREQAPTVDDWIALKKQPELYPGVHFVNRCHRFGIEPAALRSFVEAAIAGTGTDLEAFPDRCRLVHAIGEHVRESSGADRWGIKIMRELRIVAWYADLWPKAQFVHIVRDGRDVAASQMREHGTWGYADIRQAAEGWVDLVERTRKAARTYDVHEIRYEDLVLEPEPALRPLLSFLGVDWDPALLQHTEVDHALFDNAYDHPSIDTVTQPINASAVGRFRRDLAAAEIDVFHDVAGACLESLGYAVT